MTPNVSQNGYALAMPRRASRDIGVRMHYPKDDGRPTFRDPAHAAENGGGYLAGGMLLASRFEVDVADPAVPYDVRMTVFAHRGHLSCEQLVVCYRDGGPTVTGTGVRQAVIDTYLARVREELGSADGALLLFRPSVDEQGRRVYGVTQDVEQWDTFEAGQRRERPAELREVADLYRAALSSADPNENRAPVATVARRLRVHRGHASRLVSRARKEGLLDVALRDTNGKGRR